MTPSGSSFDAAAAGVLAHPYFSTSPISISSMIYIPHRNKYTHTYTCI